MACRLYAWPLDHSTQFTQVTTFVNPDEVEQRPESVSIIKLLDDFFFRIFKYHHISFQGCYVSGLHLEGAQWDIEKNCLKRSHPKVLVTELPIVYITPIEVNRLNLLVRDHYIAFISILF